ncbi:MAG: hypothetical protein MUE95_14210 [Cyclobacteriaceae bacterium]|jgi:hypothetical protein|nr:hypothetical protein [Cyclobacteriaceae bacterium]
MKFLIQLVSIIIAALVLELFFPWWSIAVAAAAGGLLFRTSRNFLAGFTAIALMWITKALWLDLTSASELTQQIAGILMVKSPVLLYFVTALLGGLVGGFASMTGALLLPEKKRRY